MRTSMSNRCERNTATEMDSGTSRKESATPVLRRSRARGVLPPTKERSTGSWKGKVPTTERVVPKTIHFVCRRCSGEENLR
jgi:hypothetical protein